MADEDICIVARQPIPPVKNQYFGDVNDYVTYGLLRCFAQAGFRIGVCWMLTPDDSRPDGGKVGYLSRPDDWKHHDPGLFAHLSRTLGCADGRHVRHIEARGHIPNARFYGAFVPDSRAQRAVWYRNALAHLKGSDLLFFDPDNGVEIASKSIGQKDSSKYVYWQELTEGWAHGQSVLVFQHFPRVKRDDYIHRRVREMQARLPGSSVIALRSSNVLFLLAYRAACSARVSKAVGLTATRWARRVWMHPCDPPFPRSESRGASRRSPTLHPGG